MFRNSILTEVSLYNPWKKFPGLALELTKPKPETNEIITELSSELNLTLDSNTYCTVYLVKTDLPIDLAITAMEELYKDFCKYLAHQHIDCIYIEKKSQYLVYFLFSQIQPVPGFFKMPATTLSLHLLDMVNFF